MSCTRHTCHYTRYPLATYMVLCPHSNNCSNNIIHFFGHGFNFFLPLKGLSEVIIAMMLNKFVFAISSPITLWRCKWSLKERVQSRLHHHPKTYKRHFNTNLILLFRAISLPNISLKLEKPASEVARTTTSAGLPSVTLNFDLRPWPTKMI